MADKIYSVNQESPENISGFESFNSQDVSLINSFEINTLFNPDKNFMELHVISLIDEVLESDYNYVGYKQLGNAQSAGKPGASTLTLDPVADVKRYGYENGSVKLLYHFLNDLFSENKTPVEFFIESISEDRTELRLQTLQLSSDQIIQRVAEVKRKLQDQSFFSEFRLDFKSNDLFIGLNIDTVDLGLDKAVVVKLYEPLPLNYVEKSKLSIVEVVADSVAYEVDYEVVEQEPESLSLKPANFSLEVTDDHVIPTGYFNYEELFAYPVNNSNSQIYSMINQKGIELSIDHTDYSNFVHFSSAQERLLNFKYKLDLISSSYANINTISNATTGLTGVSGSQAYYNGVIEGILNNFDHYERFLYYESGSHSWPKSNSVKPYVNQPSSTVESVNWFANQLTSAVAYDLSNYNSVLSAIPSYIKDDTDNEPYLTFMFMIGQHFDLLRVYAKAVSDKYNADNRLEYGIPKDLVSEALKNFGVKLYTSNKSIEDLFSTITGQSYQSGSEVINTYITGSLTGSNTPIQPVSYDGYTKEVQKRIYHNLPLLLKSKGTERGLRALINCFGIPSETLQIKLYGGRNTGERPFYGDYEYYTSSLDKVRLDNTGSLVSGSTLSQYTSIYKRDSKYTDDLHVVEVGFSPTDNVDNLIISYSLATGSLSTFNIDDYIGDPRSLNLGTYGILDSSGSLIRSLEQVTNQVMSSSAAYNVQDYVRLIKFFDNAIFKMVKDYIPARAVVNTGVIIKPHLLQRSKIKSPSLSGSRPEHTGSIDTAFIESSDGDTFGAVTSYDTAYVDAIQSPTGITNAPFLHNHQQPKYNGEFSGSTISTTNGELNEDNPYKDLLTGGYDFGTIQYVSSSNEICLLSSNYTGPLIITSSTFNLTPEFLFSFTRAATVYSTSSVASAIGGGTPGNPYSVTTLPFNFTGYSNYDQIYVSASSVDIVPQPCSTAVLVRFATCSLGLTTMGSNVVNVRQGTSVPSTDLTTWFNINPLQTQVQYTASYGTTVEGISNPTAYHFTQPVGTSVTITLVDPYSSNCQVSTTVTVGQCSFTTISTGSSATGLEFEFSEYRGIGPNDPVLTIDEVTGTNVYTEGTVLNGTIFNTYGIPVDPTIGFMPRYLQLPRSTSITQYGTPPSTYVLQNGRDRGIQSYFYPYCPILGQGLQIPPDIVFNVYSIKNDPGDVLTPVNLLDNTKYIHTVSDPSGTDTYIAYLEYAALNLSDLTNLSLGNVINTALGAAIVRPSDPDISGPNSTYQQLNPIYFVTPPRQLLLDPVYVNGSPNQQVQVPTDVSVIRSKYPVAYYIEGVTSQGITCTQGITIYPKNSVFPSLTPSSKPVGQSAPGYVFVDKTVFVNTSQVAWGTPIGNVTSITVPIRKRG